jgi:UDP-glucose 4-epimerase
MDRNVALAVRNWSCPSIYISTCGVYDRYSTGLKREIDPVNSFDSPYLAAKLVGERYFREMPGTTILRLSGPVGPGYRQQFILGFFLNRALRSENLEVWGTGTREQDFVDVRDIARAVQLSLDRPAGGTFNVASGRAVTMRDLAQTVCDVLGRGSVRQSAKPDAKEGQTARFSVNSISNALGWRPQYSLSDAIANLLLEEAQHQIEPVRLGS